MSSLVATCEGQFIKSLPLMNTESIYGMHGAFGLVSEEGAQKRRISAKRKNAFGLEKSWLYQFRMKMVDGKAVITPVKNCKIENKDGAWLIEAMGKTLHLSPKAEEISVPMGSAHHDHSALNRYVTLACLALFILMASTILMWKPTEEVATVDEVLPEPITVTITKHDTVKITPVATGGAQSTLKALTKSGVSHRAVPQNLGFLGLVGQKNLTKALGGAQTNLNGSPGAGKGGKGGSGGEFLSGLGRGVRATTVGNTGMKGLGGVGSTKGMGGGGGGYGDVAIASGEGAGISSIAVTNGNGSGTGTGVGIDGGLDRHVIQATIAKYLSQVRACYEDRLRSNPGLAGTLNMLFEIGPMGKLNFAKVGSSSVGDAAVGSCVTAKMMAGWEFPKPRGGVNVKVNYPFDLRPVGL